VHAIGLDRLLTIRGESHDFHIVLHVDLLNDRFAHEWVIVDA
jgi:hypothetical protein